jgi:hypothetical protein
VRNFCESFRYFRILSLEYFRENAKTKIFVSTLGQPLKTLKIKNESREIYIYMILISLNAFVTVERMQTTVKSIEELAKQVQNYFFLFKDTMSVADPDLVGTGPFLSDSDQDPDPGLIK